MVVIIDVTLIVNGNTVLIIDKFDNLNVQNVGQILTVRSLGCIQCFDLQLKFQSKRSHILHTEGLACTCARLPKDRRILGIQEQKGLSVNLFSTLFIVAKAPLSLVVIAVPQLNIQITGLNDVVSVGHTVCKPRVCRP